MNIAPPVFETTTLAVAVTDRIYTHITSVTGSYTFLDLFADASDSVTLTESFSSFASNAVDQSGHATFIQTYSPWAQFSGGEPANIIWRWGPTDIRELVGQLVANTINVNIFGTTETKSIISGGYDQSEFLTGISLTEIIEVTEPERLTSTALDSWQTTTFPTQIITTAEAQTQQQVWTFSESDWTQTQIETTSQGTQSTDGTREGTAFSGFSITLDMEQSLTTVITCSEAFGNTLILAQGSENVPYAMTTTETAQPQPLSAVSTLFGEVDWIQEPTLNFFNLVDGVAGYVTQLTTTTEALQVNWSRTRTSNVTNANVLTTNNFAPRVFVGQVITSSATTPTLTNITTTMVPVTAVTHGTATTSVVFNRTSNFGPAQTSFTNTTVFTIETYIPAPEASQQLGQDFIEGFSVSTTGSFIGSPDTEYFENTDNFVSITWINPKIEILPRLGVTSLSAALQTQRINTLSFAVGAQGQDGASYANTTFLSKAPTRSLFFAPKSALEFLPITGSGSGSTFTFSYSGDSIFQTFTTQVEGAPSTTTSSELWSVVGSAQSYWVDVSRNRVSGSPPAPTTIPALIIGGTGQAFLPRGLYETYSGGVTAATSGSQQFADGGSVSVFAASEGVTAVKPIPYFTTVKGTATSINTTAVSYRNNLTAQPIDD